VVSSGFAPVARRLLSRARPPRDRAPAREGPEVRKSFLGVRIMHIVVRALPSSLALLLAASSAFATKPQPPFRVDSKLVDPDAAKLGGTAEVSIAVSTVVDLDDVRVAVDVPAQLALLRGIPDWRGGIAAGSPLELSLPVAIVDDGEFDLVVRTESGIWSRRDVLHFFVSDKGVLATTEDPFRVRWDRARSDAARARLLVGRIDPVVVPPDQEPTPDPNLERALGVDAASGEEPPAPYGLAARDVRVRARLFYQDIAGTMHPMRLVRVDVVDDDSPGADQLLRTTRTDTAGRVDTTVTVPDPVDGDGSDVDLKLVIHCAIMNNQVASIGATLATTYQVVSAVVPNYAGVDLDFGDLSTGTPVSGGGAGDNLDSRRFAALDGLLQAAAEANVLRGGLLPKLPIVMPSTVGTSAFCGDHIRPADCTVLPGGQCAAVDQLHILHLDAFDWDVLCHEFGHYVMKDGATADLDESCGGPHSSGTSNIGVNGNDKARGMRLAWSEGAATWFSIALQREGSLRLPSIPNAGDTDYDDTEDLAVTLSLESASGGGAGVGYADELTVMRVLWDLQDSASDTSPDSTARDQISRTFAQMWALLNRDANNTLPRLWQSIAERAPSTRLLVRAAGAFAMNDAAPEALTPADDAVLSPVVGATFTWARNGDPSATYYNADLKLLISKDDWSTFTTFGPFAGTSYTVPDAMWAPLFADADLDTVYRWVILGRNTAAPTTPGGGTDLTGYFVSQEKRFTPKAIEIKMTWTTLGADVDLHLRPPDGAAFVGWMYSNDCAYYHLTPEWGNPGPADNPSLDRDCITTCTEENITLDTATAPGTYKVIAHYFRDHGLGPTSVTVEVKRFGRVVRTATMTLSNSGDDPDGGDVWTVFTFTRSAFGFDFGGFGVGDPEGTVRHGSEPSGPAPPKLEE
jgi:hypothetical protein